MKMTNFHTRRSIIVWFYILVEKKKKHSRFLQPLKSHFFFRTSTHTCMWTHTDFFQVFFPQIKGYSFCLSPSFAHDPPWPEKATTSSLAFLVLWKQLIYDGPKGTKGTSALPNRAAHNSQYCPSSLHFQETTDNLPEPSNQYLLLLSASSTPNRVCMPSVGLGGYCQYQARKV